MNKNLLVITGFLLALTNLGCKTPSKPDSDDIARAEQEKILQEGNREVGMPAITNFFEKKTLKTIYELRDQEGYVTYTYLFSEVTGKLIPLCRSIGYGIPAATQFTNPSKVDIDRGQYGGGNTVIPQADPNGLFSPQSADATWVACYDKKNDKLVPLYVEPKITVSPFKLEGVNF